ncbi:MAG: amino acid permease [Lachnospiraceae bacterium]|nr:amino acid permease [Lachnospiraceae bacterium]
MESMSHKGILPKWFGGLNKEAIPKNALLFLMGISVFVPFLGRTAIGWIIDVNTIGATVAYGYTSAAACACAAKEGDKKVQATGIIGIAAAVIFFIYFMVISTNAMSTESYLILAAWSILGFVYFRQVFSRDKEGRFGKSTVVWIGLLFLIFLTSLLWVRKATGEMTRQVVKNISEYYEEEEAEHDRATVARTERYLAEQMEKANGQLVRNSIIQMVMIVAALAIMLNVYGIMSKRQKEAELQRQIAEESSKAKTIFLSNMSHDIRTPMNAIIGYINLSKQEDPTKEQLKEYLGKIEYSSRHLLALINDVLEMSRIESGKMNLEPIAVDLKKSIAEVRDMFLTQMEEKHIDFSVDVSQIKHPYVYCDKNRLNRVLLNLLSNAYKFTPEYGTVSVSAWEIESAEEGYGKYEIRVKDSGIGMTDEFAARVFEAFERERNSTVSGIEGTGLGMAITKSIVDLMQGSIVVNTAPEKGTEFIITLPLRLQEGKEALPEESPAEEKEPQGKLDFSRMRLLLVEDMMVNREIATMLLKNLGFAIETAENGKEGADKVAAAAPGYYNAVLMDIQMPVMDGYEATRTIRGLENKELAGIPIIAMTANAFSEDVRKAHEAGMNGHIAKPIDMDNLISTLKDVLG